MGAGISYVTTNKAQIPVRLKDKDPAGLNRGMAYIDRLIHKRLQRRSITAFEAGQERRRVTPTLDFSGFQNVDLVIEAVFEDLQTQASNGRRRGGELPAGHDFRHQHLVDSHRQNRRSGATS